MSGRYPEWDDDARNYLAASLEYGVNPLVGSGAALYGRDDEGGED